jgi:hypothetical protein
MEYNIITTIKTLAIVPVELKHIKNKIIFVSNIAGVFGIKRIKISAIIENLKNS